MLSEVASLIGAGVSVVALFAGLRATRKSHALQVRVVAIEEARREEARRAAGSARITVHRTEGKSGLCLLALRNAGLAPAREIVISFDGQDCRSHPAGGLIRELPTIIAPECEVTVPLLVAFGMESVRRVRISWTDATNARCEMETSLT